jgi:putative DNA primase/helicase
MSADIIPVKEFRKMQNKKTERNDVVTEDSAATMFAEKYRNRLRYCHTSRRWYEWTGTHWQRDDKRKAFQWGREVARELAQDDDVGKRIAASKASFAGGVERFAQSDPVFAVTADCWDIDPYLLGTPGGTVELLTGKLRKARPEDHITQICAVAPTETADCPRWLQFLDETTGGDVGLIRFLQQWCGYSLTGDVSEHALVFGYGSGGNGKSVLLNVVSGVLHDYAKTATLTAFTATKHDRHATEYAMLKGARLVTASESEEGRSWAEARIKQMTGGDPITANEMHKDPFTFRPTFKLMITGNHQPNLRNVDDAARRRFNIVPFTRRPEKPDKDLEKNLEKEWPGILRWMIDGCLDWKENGLMRPDCVLAATEEYFVGQDLFGQWLDDECDAEPGNSYKTATSGELFGSWNTFAKKSGEDPGSSKRFAAEMKRRGFLNRKGTAGVREWMGIRKKPQATFADL